MRDVHYPDNRAAVRQNPARGRGLARPSVLVLPVRVRQAEAEVSLACHGGGGCIRGDAYPQKQLAPALPS